MAKPGQLDNGRVYTKKGWRRRILIRGLTALAAIVVVVGVIGIWVASALPGIAAAEISRLTNTRIEMGRLDYRSDGSVLIGGLVVRPEREAPSYDDAILRAENVYAKFSLRSLLLLAPRVTEIRCQNFLLDVQCDLDTGAWNVGGLQLSLASDLDDDAVPTITLLNGQLRYCRIADGQTDVVMRVPIEARLGASASESDRYDFEVRTGTLAGGYGQSRVTGSWLPGRFELAGGFSSTDIPSLERAWAVESVAAELTYDENRDYELDLRVENLHTKHSPEIDAIQFDPTGLMQSGPLATAQRFFARYRPFGTVGQIGVKAKGNLDALNDSELTGTIVCTDVSLRDSRFPYAIEGLVGQVDFTQSMVVMDHLAGRHGDVDVQIEGWTRGYGDEREYHYEVTSDNMVLDQDLYAALPPGQKRFWDSFAPRGLARIEYLLTRSTPVDARSRISVDLKNVAATYKRFPYPLEGLTGNVTFDPEQAIVSEVATHVGPRIWLDGRVSARNTARPVYRITVDAEDVPLDATLRKALPAAQRRAIGPFDASGLIDVHASVFTAEPDGGGPVTFLADVSFEDTSLTMEGLPAAVSDISAEASVTPESLRVKQASGRYGQSQVSLTGALRVAADGPGQQYRFEIATKQTRLDEAVIDLLPESMRQAVSAFRPEGLVNLAVDLAKAEPNEPPDYAVVVECLGNEVNWQRFAYPLDDVRGSIIIDANAVRFDGITARPASQAEPGLDPLIEIAGHISLDPATRGEAAFTVQARDVLLTDALAEALPKDLAGIYRDLSPRGPLGLDVPTLRISNTEPGGKLVEFGGRAIVPTCSLNISGTGAELSGQFQIDGVYDTKEGLGQGRVQLSADRATVKNKDITDLRADVVYDPNAQTWTAHNFLGDCYEGKVLGQLEIGRIEPGVAQYLVTAALNRVNLQPFLLADKVGVGADRNYTSGTMNAVLSLGAKVGNGASRLGLCRVDVADMQVGKVSPLANLLAVLSLTEPTDYAFERMLIESYLRRNKLLITKFDLSGRSLAFVGSGTMDLGDGDVNLTLTARGRRLAATQPSLLQSLTEGLGGGVVRMEVTGPADSPKVETRTLPMLEESLRILGTPR